MVQDFRVQIRYIDLNIEYRIIGAVMKKKSKTVFRDEESETIKLKGMQKP